jgi:hypothetical protein
MRNRRFVIILLAATGLWVVTCTPMRMGVQEATLEKLLEKQADCDELRQHGLMPNTRMVECQNNSNALEKAAGEYAEEGGRQSSPANKVFWYSLAATAGWQSRRPQGTQDAITYADEGVRICDDNPGIQPGDCAYMYAIPAFVSNASVATLFSDLEQMATGTAEGMSLAERQKALQKLYLFPQPDGLTRIETMASLLLRNGWETLQISMQKVRKLEGLHEDVICALAANQGDIVENLETLHKRAVTLPLLPENTGWIAAGLCQDGSINPETTAGLNLAPEGADFATLDEDGKRSLIHRAMVGTYCKWQYAEQHTAPDACRED